MTEDTCEVSQYENDLMIDPQALDIEWLEQPMKFFYYSEKLARSQRELARLKLKQDVVQAQVDAKIRNQYLDKKPTENAIKGAIFQDPDVINIFELVADQEETVALINASVRSFEQRKSSLENLVKLQAQNYNAGPKEPRNLKLEYDKKTKQQQAFYKIRENITKEEE